MSEPITHVFISAKTQSPDTTLVSKNEWNDGHTFLTGANGQHLVYDDTQPNNMRWSNASSAGGNTSAISASTPTPISNLAAVSFTLQTAAVTFVSYQAVVYTSTGAAAGTVTLVLDTVDISSFSIPSGITQPASIGTSMSLAAGAHTLSLRLNVAGNVNVLTLNVSINIMIVGA
jgi:hypothetical protein